MFGIYTKKTIGNKFNYEFIKETSLAGCNSGLLPAMVQRIAPSGQGEPFIWEVNLIEQLHKLEGENRTLVIDIKPNNKKYKEVLLCELLEARGYSDYGWTPLLLHLKCLIDEEEHDGLDRGNFSIDCNKKLDDVFTITALMGSIKEGRLTGKWTFPGPSATNSALLWPPIAQHFCEIINQFKGNQSE